MSDLKASFDQARQRLRHRLGLRAATSLDVEPSAPPSEDAGAGVSVLHRVLAFEDNQQDPAACNSPDSDIIPLPAALSHSLSGTWRQRFDDTGKPVWQRDAREADTTEVIKETEYILNQFLQQPSAVRVQHCPSLETDRHFPRDGQLLLQLPRVHSLKQAKQQCDALQLQAYQKTRMLQEAKFSARQAAEQLLSLQMQHSEAELGQSDVRDSDASDAVMQEHVQKLRAAQARMLELSEQVSVAELASEMSEARAKLIEVNSGDDAVTDPHDRAASLGSSPREDMAPPSSPQTPSPKASSAGSSCGSTCGRTNHMLSLSQRLQRLSSSLTYDDLPMTSSSEPTTPTGMTSNTTSLAPDTPIVFRTPVMSDASGSGDASADKTSADVGHGPPDSESTIERLQAVTGHTIATSAQGEGSSSVPAPLPDLPTQAAGRADEAQRAVNSRRYVHIGCAVACLCVFALWARDASAASFSTRIFPT